MRLKNYFFRNKKLREYKLYSPLKLEKAIHTLEKPKLTRSEELKLLKIEKNRRLSGLTLKQHSIYATMQLVIYFLHILIVFVLINFIFPHRILFLNKILYPAHKETIKVPFFKFLKEDPDDN